MPAVKVIAALQGLQVFCKEKVGLFEGSIIHCQCCNKEYAPSAFEHHSGSSFRRPWKSIKDCNGKSIQEYRDEQDLLDPHYQEKPTDKTAEKRRIEDADDYPSPKYLKVESSKRANDDSTEDQAVSPRQSEAPSLNFASSSRSTKQMIPRAFKPSLEIKNIPIPTIEKEEEQEEEEELQQQPETEIDMEDDFYDSASDSDCEDVDIISIVNYNGACGIFMKVPTFEELLERALEHWEINTLTNPKDWMLTNHRGDVWPPHIEIADYSPEMVYLRKVKP
eukprot:TRINITY_DN7852_c0_g1_i1.p1 TRINITY_DN7852_c0_g1~~TRINITY_DN7852_c0_g1_i1.p1  ORF type:complete len:278 (-),score=72.73 TRINITY_DN7852_c0_g1_i1:216-1049(-)